MNVCIYLFSLTHDLVIVTGGHFIASNVRSTCDRGQKSQSLSGLKCCTYHTPLDYVTCTIRGLWHCHGTRQQFEDLPRIPSFFKKKTKKLSPTAPHLRPTSEDTQGKARKNRGLCTLASWREKVLNRYCCSPFSRCFVIAVMVRKHDSWPSISP